MLLNNNINEIDKIIFKIINRHEYRKIFYCIIMSIILSALFEYDETRPFSLQGFIQCSFVLLVFILTMYYFLTKEGVAIQSTYVDQAIQNVLINNWSFPPLKAVFLTNALSKHPVFISLIGLYAYKYGKKDQGLSLISLAEQRLPLIGEAIKDGNISDKRKFEELREIIYRDIYPKTIVKFFQFSIFIYGIIALLLLAWLCLYLLLHYFK